MDHWAVVEKYFQAFRAWGKALRGRGVAASLDRAYLSALNEYDCCWQAVMALDGQAGLPEVIQRAISAYKALYDAGGGKGNDAPRPKVQQDFSWTERDKLIELGFAFEDVRAELRAACRSEAR
jgi:hypothetical protein